MREKTSITIIGAGEMGRAISDVLAKKSLNIEVWDIVADKVPERKPLSETIPFSDIVFLCIPSWSIRDVAQAICPFLRKKTLVVTVSKGIEAQSGRTIDELMEELFASVSEYALLGGAMLAEELVEKFGIGVVASARKENFDMLEELFTGTHLYLEYNDDLHGVAVCGVLKNIYAILLGAAEGLGYGYNVKGWLFNQSIKEIGELVVLLGGKKDTIFSSAGVGDFVATGFSEFSSNRQAGKDLATSGMIGKKSEGLVSLPFIVEGITHIDDFPLLKAVNSIVVAEHVSKDTFEELFLGHTR